MKRQKRGQTILEYVIIITAIIGALIVAAPIIQTSVQGLMNRAAGKIDNATLE
jgi:Flp pilus assembly pilin Flp